MGFVLSFLLFHLWSLSEGVFFPLCCVVTAMGYEPLDTVCLGSCLMVVLKTMANAVRFSERLLLFHSTAVYLLLQILPVSSAPSAQGQCLLKQSERSAKCHF